MHDVHPRDTADQRGDIGAEVRGDAALVIACDIRQPDEQRRRQRVGIESLAREDAGGAERAIDQRLAIGMTGIAERSVRRLVRPREAAAIGVGVDRRERIEPRADGLRRSGPRRGMRDGNHGEL